MKMTLKLLNNDKARCWGGNIPEMEMNLNTVLNMKTLGKLRFG